MNLKIKNILQFLRIKYNIMTVCMQNSTLNARERINVFVHVSSSNELREKEK